MHWKKSLKGKYTSEYTVVSDHLHIILLYSDVSSSVFKYLGFYRQNDISMRCVIHNKSMRVNK